jgi:4-amino-4-deoxy-L-arabinose transferase-like glycosyltransferase
LQSGNAGIAAIAHDLLVTDVHPPLYFWLVSLWRAVLGHDLFVARLLSVALGLGAIALIGVIARSARLPPVRAMLLTAGCYGFTYTSAIARGFALAQLLLLGGVACLLLGRRRWHFAFAGVLFGAATFTNYLALFAAAACLLALAWSWSFRNGDRAFPAAMVGFLVFVPADLWWFLAQRGSRQGQFPPFSLFQSLVRLAVRSAGAVLGGLPLYVDGVASSILAGALSLLLLWLVGRVAWRWRRVGDPRARRMFALAALATPVGLLVLGEVFNNTPIEVRYLTFSTPFLALLLAGTLETRGTAVLLAVQFTAIVGLMLAPQTMQPAQAAARAAAALVANGVVLLPRGNDGVGVVGAFAIEAPPALPLLLIRAEDTPAQIRTRLGPWRRIVLAMLEQDASSRAASEAMRAAVLTPGWREVARGPLVAVYERIGDGR